MVFGERNKKKMNECHWKSILKSVTHVDIGNFWFTFVTALKCACISCSVLSYLDNSTTMGAETHVNHREIRYFSVNIHVHNCSQIFLYLSSPVLRGKTGATIQCKASNLSNVILQETLTEHSCCLCIHGLISGQEGHMTVVQHYIS